LGCLCRPALLLELLSLSLSLKSPHPSRKLPDFLKVALLFSSPTTWSRDWQENLRGDLDLKRGFWARFSSFFDSEDSFSEETLKFSSTNNSFSPSFGKKGESTHAGVKKKESMAVTFEWIYFDFFESDQLNLFRPLIVHFLYLFHFHFNHLEVSRNLLRSSVSFELSGPFSPEFQRPLTRAM
jgi:hypothetical protein